MITRPSGWKYYIPEDGEAIADAVDIRLWGWMAIIDPACAAKYASEDDWDNRDGWERGTGDGPFIVVVSPDGVETTFETYREPEIYHTVTEVEC